VKQEKTKYDAPTLYDLSQAVNWGVGELTSCDGGGHSASSMCNVPGASAMGTCTECGCTAGNWCTAAGSSAILGLHQETAESSD
jgi:hypothetical protein